MIAALAVELRVAPADLLDDVETAKSPEMLATIANYLEYRAAKTEGGRR